MYVDKGKVDGIPNGGGSKAGAGGVSALVTILIENACGGTFCGAIRRTFGATGIGTAAAGSVTGNIAVGPKYGLKGTLHSAMTIVHKNNSIYKKTNSH